MSLEYKFDYVNLQPTETLENLTQKKLKPLSKKVDGRTPEGVEVHVKFVVDSRSPYGNLKDSHVMIEVKIPGIPKKLMATKKDVDLRVAVNKSCDALLKEVRRYSEKQTSKRQH